MTAESLDCSDDISNVVHDPISEGMDYIARCRKSMLDTRESYLRSGNPLSLDFSIFWEGCLRKAVSGVQA